MTYCAPQSRGKLPRVSGARRPGLRHGLGQFRQDFRPLFRDRYRVLDVRRGLSVERLRLVRAHVEHRLDGEDVARTNFDARARLSVVRDLRVFVHFPADAVADVVAHDAVAVCFGERLHGPADVSEVLARPALTDGPLKTLLGDADKLQPVLAHLPDGDGRRRVADVAGERHAAVNREDVALT